MPAKTSISPKENGGNLPRPGKVPDKTIKPIYKRHLETAFPDEVAHSQNDWWIN